MKLTVSVYCVYTPGDKSGEGAGLNGLGWDTPGKEILVKFLPGASYVVRNYISQ